jgi:hypothetical protein
MDLVVGDIDWKIRYQLENELEKIYQADVVHWQKTGDER